jgi:hypothetical protein
MFSADSYGNYIMPPKKLRLLLAYSLLALSSVSILVCDALNRNRSPVLGPTAPVRNEAPVYVPQPLTRLDESPFLNPSRALPAERTTTAARPQDNSPRIARTRPTS